MNRYLPLIGQLQDAVTTGGDVAGAEAALKAALPDGAAHEAYLLRSAMQTARKRDCPNDDPRCCTDWDIRRRVLTHGLTPGHPVGLVTFAKQPGAAAVQGFFVQGCGAPTAGNYLDGGVDADIPHAVRVADISNRTTADIEARLRGWWRVVDPAEAVAELAAAGFVPCGEHAFLHPAVGPDRWTRTDETHWAAYAVRV